MLFRIILFYINFLNLKFNEILRLIVRLYSVFLKIFYSLGAWK
jgi:hypothetical protein